MSATRTTTSLTRVQAVAFLLAIGAAVGAIIGLAEMLRHPATEEAHLDPVDDDPRVEFDCDRVSESSSRDLDGGGVGPARGSVAVDSDDLYECPRVYDGARVRYEGEVVGALLPRGAHTWAQLNDDVYATELGALPAHRTFRGGNASVGVALPAEIAADIVHVGGPDDHGDTVAVTGVFHREHDETGEVAIIVAEQAAVVSSGEPVDHVRLGDRRVAGILLAVAAVAVAGAERLTRR